MPRPGGNRVEITGRPPVLKVTLDGHMLACSRAVLTVDAGNLPVLEVTLPVVDGVAVTVEDAAGIFGEDTRKALVAMGWTPPERAHSHTHTPGDMPQMVDLFAHLANAHGLNMAGSGYIAISDIHDALHGHQHIASGAAGHE